MEWLRQVVAAPNRFAAFRVNRARTLGTVFAANPTMAKTRRKPDNSFANDAGPQFSGDNAAATMDRDRVAQRAYELYLERGCGDGQDVDDWLCAERELSSELTPTAAEAHDRGGEKKDI
jgi:hypothetical protein